MKIEKETIKDELLKIEKQHGVIILHAVESGSRAWGFPSPDSDYDVRFVYVHPARDYIRLDAPRDVIEWVDDGVLDINGWDLRKAMIQFAKGNASLFEWVNSPIVYSTTPQWQIVQETARAYFSEKAAVCHYYGLAMNTWTKHLTGEKVSYKKYFYALRPLLAAQYIERYHTISPVSFSELLSMEIPEDLRSAIDELLQIKKVTGEGNLNPQIPVIQTFIQDELPKQKKICDELPDDRNTDWEPMNDCFARMIGIIR